MPHIFPTSSSRCTAGIPAILRKITTQLFLLLLISMSAMQSANAQCCGAEPTTYQQPDGTVIEVHFHGTELYTRTTSSDGYTLIFDPQTKAYYYAKLVVGGKKLQSTGRLAKKTKPADLKLPRHLKLDADIRRQMIAERKAELDAIRQDKAAWEKQKKAVSELRAKKEKKSKRKLKEVIGEPSGENAAGTSGQVDVSQPASDSESAPPVNPPTLGDIVGLTILVDFADEQARPDITPADIDDYLNKPGGNWNNNASVHEYFKIQSSGRLNYNNIATYYVRMPQPKSFYNDTAVSNFTKGRELLQDAIAQLLADGYDFGNLTTDPNNGEVIATNIMWAGNTSGVFAKGLWPHRASVSRLDIGNGKFIRNYQATHIGSSGTPTIGTFCHENGHLLGKYPDYYDTDGGRGLGMHCLMSTGNQATGTNPTNISSYLKYHSGWIDAVELTDLATPVRLAAAVDNTIVYKYTNTAPGWTDEYFMIENRSKVGGWEATSGLRDSGLMISHIHESGGNSVSGPEDQMTEAQHYEHSIEQADGQYQLEGQGTWGSSVNAGDNTDFFHAGGTGPNTEFSDTTTPHAKWWAGATTAQGTGTDSGLHIHSVSAAGSTMTFVYGTGTPTGAAVTGISRTFIERITDFGVDAAAQTFSIFNSGGGTLSYSVSDNQSWLNSSISSGTATTEADTVTVNFNTAGLAAGVHNAIITVDGGGGGIQTIPVTLTVSSQPTLSASVASIELSGLAGLDVIDAVFDLANTGGGTADYSLSQTQSWLSISHAAGTLGLERDSIILELDATGLAPGVYTDTITINSANATNSPLNIPVTFTVENTDMVLTAPDGGESWLVGLANEITWSSSLGGNVKIELLKGGVLDSVIAASTSNDGAYIWIIPLGQTLGSDYKIRVTSVESPGISDQSFGDFTIAPDAIGEALDISGQKWTSSGDADWFVQTQFTQDGVDAAQSGAITSSQTTSIETSFSEEGTLTFWWKVSSEQGFDVLRLSVDGVEQTGELGLISGEVDWVQKTLPIPAGGATVKWTYSKDFSVNIGADAGWIDQLVFTPASTTFTVSFDGNGNTGGTVPADQTKTQGIDLTLASNIGNLVKTGFTFQGWNTLADGTGTDYAAGGTYSTDADLTLFAKWAAVPTFTVSYNGNGNTGGTVPADQIKTQGVPLTLSGNTGNLTRTDFVFSAWNSQPDGTGTSYPAGGSFNTDANTTLYAEWSPAPDFNWLGGTLNDLNNTNYSTGTSPFNSVADVVNITGGGMVKNTNAYSLEGVDTYNVFNGGVIQNNKPGNKVINGNGATVNVGDGGTYAPGNRMGSTTLNLSGTGNLLIGNDGESIDPSVSGINLDSAWTGEIYFTAQTALDEVSELMTWLDSGGGAGDIILNGSALTSAGLGTIFQVDVVASGSGSEPAFATSDAGLSLTLIGGGDSFASWIAGFSNLGGLTGFGDDPEGDGVANGLENYFGTHPGQASQGLRAAALEVNGNSTFTFSHPLNDAPAADLTAQYVWSMDLSSFHADGTTADGTTVSFQQGSPVDGIVTVTATITGSIPQRLFVNLQITQN